VTAYGIVRFLGKRRALGQAFALMPMMIPHILISLALLLMLTQIALPEAEAPVLARMGAALAALRDEGVLLVASGGIVHNLSRVRLDDPAGAPDPWAVRFDAWCAERIAALDLHGLARWREDAPDALLAQPTPEHLAPLFVALGAQAPGDRVETVFEGIRHGNLSMRSFALRPGGDPVAPHRSTHSRKEQPS
jgi:4,5-DOPA dioxygenase extradiol